MAETTGLNNTASKSLSKSIILTGLLAGTLDALGATIAFLIRGGKDPSRIFNFIASAVFGEAGLNGGTAMAWLGLLFHYMIATIWTTLFFVAYSRVELLRRNWVAVGIGYGVFVWLGMNLIVVPLSRTPSIPKTVSGVIVGAFVLMICIGLPISYMVNKHYKERV